MIFPVPFLTKCAQSASIHWVVVPPLPQTTDPRTSVPSAATSMRSSSRSSIHRPFHSGTPSKWNPSKGAIAAPALASETFGSLNKSSRLRSNVFLRSCPSPICA